jgi:glycosyltransferase involved in cell wall biosynthesis
MVTMLLEESSDVEYSIVMPVHNQAEIIVDNIASALEHMGGSALFECIVIFDGCEDNSEDLVKTFFETNRQRYVRLARVVLIRQPTSIFETASDNMGFLLSRGKYIIEIQADMRIISHNFNEILATPCRIMKNVCGVSGRCCHAWKNGPGIGRLDASFGIPGKIPQDHKNKFFVANTCNRGPLLLDREKLVELGYLDQQNFYLDDSDHDFFARAHLLKGWICGYVPIDVYAPMNHGSNRKPRNAHNQQVLEYLRSRSNGGFLHQNDLINCDRIGVVDLSPYITYS